MLWHPLWPKYSNLRHHHQQFWTPANAAEVTDTDIPENHLAAAPTLTSTDKAREGVALVPSNSYLPTSSRTLHVIGGAKSHVCAPAARGRVYLFPVAAMPNFQQV